MRSIVSALAAAAALLVAPAAANAAVIISIGYSFNNGAIHLLKSGTPAPGGVVSYNTPLNLGAFKLQSVSAAFGPLPDLLSSQSLDAKSTSATCANPCTLDVYVTEQNILPSMLGHDELMTSFSASAGNNTTLKTFYNANNALWGKVTPLRSLTYTKLAAADYTNFVTNPTHPFSVTEQFHLTKLGSTALTNHVNATIDLSTAAVPEPAAWALMIAGFGGAGAALRSRRRQMAAAA